MIQAGNYIAKAIGIRFVKPKDTLGIQVSFDLKPSDPSQAPQRISWTGWTSEKSQNHTIKTLDEVLEWNGDDEAMNVPETDPNFGMFKNQDCINRKKEVSLVIEIEQYDGKDRARVKWVNNVGGGQFSGCSPEVAKNDLAASGFKAAFLSRRQSAQKPQAPQQPSFAVSDIPF